MILDRRISIRLCSALAGFPAGAGTSDVRARERPQLPRRNRKNYFAIQVKPCTWVDDGMAGNSRFTGDAFYSYGSKYICDTSLKNFHHASPKDFLPLYYKYVEMWPANLSAAGETLRETFARRAA